MTLKLKQNYKNWKYNLQDGIVGEGSDTIFKLATVNRNQFL